LPRLRADDDDDVLDTKAPSSATFSKATTLFTKGGRRCFSGRRLPAKAKVDDKEDIFEEEEDAALLLRVPPPFLAPFWRRAFCVVGATTTKGALVKAPP